MDIVGWNYLLTEILLRILTTKRKLLKLKNLYIKNTSLTISITRYFKKSFK